MKWRPAHVNEGQLHTWLDGEMQAVQAEQVSDHLKTCRRCQAKAAALQARLQRTSARLACLEETPQPSLSPRAAYLRLVEHPDLSTTKETETMFQKMFSRTYRPAWIALGIVLALAFSMIFAPVRALANDFLGLFRVQQLNVVEVDPALFSGEWADSSDFQSLLSENVAFEGGGDNLPAASVEEAAALAGYRLRLPELIGETPKLAITPAGKMRFTIDLPRVQALLQALEIREIDLPQSLDGAEVVVDVANIVTAQWGACEGAPVEPAEGQDPDMPYIADCTTLIQAPSPVVTTPPGLDMQQIGQAYLVFLGMDQKQAANFAAKIDWATTFVLPIPRDQSTFRQVQVDGVEGVLVQEGLGESYGFTLIWVKDGMAYSLSGPGSTSTALELSASLK